MIDQGMIREVLDYKPKTGVFTWRRTGKRAGGTEVKGYRRITVGGKLYKEHRLAWLYMTGEWPDDQIDHKNEIKDDNRWDNLRPATNLQNCQWKTKPNSNNTSGVRGVHFNTKLEKWVAQINANGKRKGLGYFLNKEDAIFARREGEIQYGYTI